MRGTERAQGQNVKPIKRELGTCYYPEHWPDDIWKDDAQKMADLGLKWVRIGEFAWSRLEPQETEFCFEWLDRAVHILGEAGLSVVLGTPTAAPPTWVLKKYPDMLAVDSEGRPREFGSRRHYCFSHEGYREQCSIIVRKLAERYGSNPYIEAWQTDNEYGCHDTTISYSSSALKSFQHWLAKVYGNDVNKLNEDWGNVFWSMEYQSYDEILLPNLTVTEPNPSHALAFRRFTSSQVSTFNRIQTEIIREYSSAPIIHNFMGRTTDFDHFEVGEDLDIASWDSYPLGFLLDRAGATEEEKFKFLRQGDPDFQAFHHDLYRSVGNGRWWVMEQQPGPVNWAPYNPEPMPGMIRLWTWEAFAHGAETVSYFRWRQVPFAQEQMHSGLLQPNSAPAPGYFEAKQITEELVASPIISTGSSDVAIYFDYESDAAWQVQPMGENLNYFELVMDHYRAIRRLGLNVDFVHKKTKDFSKYKIISVVGAIHISSELISRISSDKALLIFGPRTGAREGNMKIPKKLPPNIDLVKSRIVRVETLPPNELLDIDPFGNANRYIETLKLDSNASPYLKLKSGKVIATREGSGAIYLGAMVDQDGLIAFYQKLFEEIELDFILMPDGVRRRCTENEEFWFNYNNKVIQTKIGNMQPADIIRLQLV